MSAVLSDDELAYLVDAHEVSGFAGGINWYRNVDRKWQLLADVDPIIHQPALIIHGSRDLVPQNERIAEFVPNVDVVALDCGHWIASPLTKRTPSSSTGSPPATDRVPDADVRPPSQAAKPDSAAWSNAGRTPLAREKPAMVQVAGSSQRAG